MFNDEEPAGWTWCAFSAYNNRDPLDYPPVVPDDKLSPCEVDSDRPVEWHEFASLGWHPAGRAVWTDPQADSYPIAALCCSMADPGQHHLPTSQRR